VETDSAVDLRSSLTASNNPNPCTNGQPQNRSIPSSRHYIEQSKNQIESKGSIDSSPVEPLPGCANTVILCVRLPNGSRVQRRFDYLRDTIKSVLLFALYSMPQESDVLSLSDVEMSSCTVPRVVYSQLSATLDQYELTQNTLLCLSLL